MVEEVGDSPPPSPNLFPIEKESSLTYTLLEKSGKSESPDTELY